MVFSIVAGLVLGQEVSIPVGGYSLEEICKRLSAETGLSHKVQADLLDYSVFVSVKAGSAARLEKLVAAAFDSEWRKSGGALTLVKSPAKADRDFEEFGRQLKASKLDGKFSPLPVKDLYDMVPGSMLRYGSNPNDFVGALPAGIKGPGILIKVRRSGFGSFEFSYEAGSEHVGPFDPAGSVNFSQLPDLVKTLLGADAGKALAPASKVSPPGGRDAITAMLSGPLMKAAAEMSCDLVVALNDSSLIAAVGDPSQPASNTVGKLLGKYSVSNVWQALDGAVVGELPVVELDHSAQARRDVLADLLKSVKGDGVVTSKVFAEYVAHQRPQASNTWNDAILLALNKAVMDEAYIGDYPFNERLAAELTDQDWNVINAGKPFLLSALSASAQQEVLTLLVQSRSRMESSDSAGLDPALWPSLAPQKLMVSPELKRETVLITEGAGGIPEVRTVDDSAFQYASRKKALNREPLYRLASRINLNLQITDMVRNSVETGITEVSIGDGVAGVAWTDLPKDLVVEFRKELGVAATVEAGAGGAKVVKP